MQCARCRGDLTRREEVYDVNGVRAQEYRCPECGHAGAIVRPNGDRRRIGPALDPDAISMPRVMTDGGRCPECGSGRVRPDGGCPVCPACGWSKCGGGRA